MGMKGISPVIAAVLLIAITVSVGVLLSSWITHWVSTRTSQASSACVTNTNYKIDSATFAASDNNMTIQITNVGRTGLYGFSVQMSNGTDVVVYNASDPNFKMSPDITESDPLTEQRSAIIIINMNGAYNSTMGSTTDQLKVLNKACPMVSADTKTISKE